MQDGGLSLGGEATEGSSKRCSAGASLGDARTLGGGDAASIDTVYDDIEVIDLAARYKTDSGVVLRLVVVCSKATTATTKAGLNAEPLSRQHSPDRCRRSRVACVRLGLRRSFRHNTRPVPQVLHARWCKNEKEVNGSIGVGTGGTLRYGVLSPCRH